MMKQTKWLVSLSACLVLMAVSAAGAKGRLAVPRGAQESGNFDTIPLPARTYSIGNEVDSILSPLSLQPFFAGLDSLRAGKDTVLTIVHLGDSHIQAGYYSGRMMRLLQEQFGNAGRGWIAPFKLSKTNEPDDYFISSSVREWVTGRCIQANKKCPVGIGGIGIQSVSPSINLDVRIAPNNGVGYSFNQAILYRGEKSMPMLPAGPNKDVQTFWDARCRDARPCVSTDVCGILADTFRILYPVDTLQLHSTRRKQGTDKLLPALNMLQQAPKLIITDSQVFDYVYQNKPAESMLTSFSVLFAAYKGDLPYYMEGARQIDALNENSHVLIAECCTHAPLSEDIGRVKIPRMLRKRFGERLRIDHVSGTDFPQDLEGYDLIIQCGACMFNRRYVVSRIDRAKAQNIPMTNYGITIAHLTGILDKIVLTLR